VHGGLGGAMAEGGGRHLRQRLLWEPIRGTHTPRQLSRGTRPLTSGLDKRTRTGSARAPLPPARERDDGDGKRGGRVDACIGGEEDAATLRGGGP